jgi:dTDP-4-dehydrorhamnose reductase
MKRIVITGGSGQLGSELIRLLQRYYHVFAPSRSELDITQKRQVEQYMADVRPYAIIHSAAYTQVDSAEIDPSMPILVNAVGTRFIATAAEQIGARLMYVSSDYVFDGTKQTPYSELDTPSPVNVYGLSKLAGERFVASMCSRYSIVRSSWLYGGGGSGNNFVEKVLTMAKQGKKIRMINDQFGTPTHVKDLAKFMMQLLQIESHGIYHASNEGSCSWYEFAVTIMKMKGIKHVIVPCRTDDFPILANRPKYSVLTSRRGMPSMQHWKAALQEYMSREAIDGLTDQLFYESI